MEDLASVLVIGLYRDHFFIDEEIEVSENWISKYNELKDVEKFQACKNVG